MTRDDMPCNHDERFKGVLFTTNECLACELEKMISENERLGLRIEELEEKQKWIDEIARPDHPDNERPWCSAYLDCRERIKELEDERDGFKNGQLQLQNMVNDLMDVNTKWANKVRELEESNEGLRDALNLRKVALVQATNGIKQLNERIDEFVERIKKYLDDPEFDTDILTKLII